MHDQRPLANEPSGRHVFIDNAKAIGIVLIVIGHSKGLPDYLVRLIFSFHVPLFFFISGFLLKPEKLQQSVHGSVKRTLRTLAVPYLFFFCFAFGYWLLTRNIGEKAILSAGRAWYQPFIGLLTGLEVDLYIDPPLWFFPCLIMTAILYQLARKQLTAVVAAGCFVVLGIAVTLLFNQPSYRLLLGLDSMWVALSFYALGQLARENTWFSRVGIMQLILFGLLASLLLVWAGSLNDQVDLATMYFGARPALYLPTSLLGIAATLAIAKLLPASRVANWLSQNTLIIFPAHFIFLGLVRGIALSLHAIPRDYHYALGWSVASSAMAILLCLPLLHVLRVLRIRL
ncbi:acyltransferase family protein [Collimonas pratensis]|nr:acyltransferase family protein [Collimonas pratensis]